MSLDLSNIKDGMAITGTALAAAFTVLSPALVAWLSKTFATKARVDELAAELQKQAERLNAGETRFVRLDAAINQACQAARDAKAAADEVAEAVTKVQDTEVSLARLEEKINGLVGSLKNVEHFTHLMLEGHMKMGANP